MKGVFLDLLLILSLLISFLLLIPLIPVVDQWYQLVIIKSGSMEPFLTVGSLGIYRKQAEYYPGQVIAYQKDDGEDKKLILHRIVAKNPQGEKTLFLTQGDATQEMTPEAVYPGQIMGRVVGSIPKFGYLIGWFKTPLGISLLIFTCLVSIAINSLF